MFHNFYPEIASENSPANLITSFLHGDDPPGILVRVGVAVVLKVGVVPLNYHTVLAAFRTPGKAAELELEPSWQSEESFDKCSSTSHWSSSKEARLSLVESC